MFLLLMKRVHYFNAQLLCAQDFQTEQDYHLAKHRRQNLRAHGRGVVSGLHVAVEANGVRVSPGIAIDGYGNEIMVDEPTLHPLPSSFVSVWLTISYAEALTDPVVAGNEGGMQPSRVEEGFKLEYVAETDVRGEGPVRLARLVWRSGRWESGKTFGNSLLRFGFLMLVLALVSRLRGRGQGVGRPT